MRGDDPFLSMMNVIGSDDETRADDCLATGLPRMRGDDPTSLLTASVPSWFAPHARG